MASRALRRGRDHFWAIAPLRFLEDACCAERRLALRRAVCPAFLKKAMISSLIPTLASALFLDGEAEIAGELSISPDVLVHSEKEQLAGANWLKYYSIDGAVARGSRKDQQS